MSEKPMTARAKACSKAELRKWGKQGRRPARLEHRAVSRLTRMLAEGTAKPSAPGFSVCQFGR